MSQYFHFTVTAPKHERLDQRILTIFSIIHWDDFCNMSPLFSGLLCCSFPFGFSVRRWLCMCIGGYVLKDPLFEAFSILYSKLSWMTITKRIPYLLCPYSTECVLSVDKTEFKYSDIEIFFFAVCYHLRLVTGVWDGEQARKGFSIRSRSFVFSLHIYAYVVYPLMSLCIWYYVWIESEHMRTESIAEPCGGDLNEWVKVERIIHRSNNKLKSFHGIVIATPSVVVLSNTPCGVYRMS